MKYIQTKLILCAMFAASPLCVNAQDVAVNESDSLNNGQDPLVQIRVNCWEAFLLSTWKS